MILNPIWHIKRFYKIKSYKGSYQASTDMYKIELAQSHEDIKEYLKQFNKDYKFSDYDYSSLKVKVYLGIVKNTEKDIIREIYKQYESSMDSFRKEFWEEYVYKFDPVWDYDRTYKDCQKRIKQLNHIKQILDSNKKYQGLSGEKLQDVYNHKLDGVELHYSWRAWGRLMAAYMNSKEKKRKYHYMDFYMG